MTFEIIYFENKSVINTTRKKLFKDQYLATK